MWRSCQNTNNSTQNKLAATDAFGANFATAAERFKVAVLGCIVQPCALACLVVTQFWLCWRVGSSMPFFVSAGPSAAAIFMQGEFTEIQPYAELSPDLKPSHLFVHYSAGMVRQARSEIAIRPVFSLDLSTGRMPITIHGTGLWLANRLSKSSSSTS